MAERFDVRFHPAAEKEYKDLDNSVITQVDKAIDELLERADEVGKPLGNKNSTKLAGLKEIKLRNIGIRVIFRITEEVVDVLKIVYILTIEQRSDDFVFKLAHKRFAVLKATPNEKARELLKRYRRWTNDEE
ncbi:MAG: type II toxin-antitoxin system RelE family toxin [Carboxydocellales bacterium]